MRKTACFYIFLLLLCTGNLFSQQNRSGPKTPLALSISPCFSIPFGVFASQNTTSARSGFAKPGGTFRVTADYNLTQKLALVLNYDRVSFHQNQTTILNSFNQSYPGYTVSNSIVGWWLINNFQLGLTNIYTIKNKEQQPKMLVENRFLLGLASISTPNTFVASTNGGSTLSFNQPAKNAPAFSLTIGGAIKSIPKNHLFMKATVDLCMSRVRFNDVQSTKNENGAITNSTKTITQPISYLSIGWAVGWQF